MAQTNVNIRMDEDLKRDFDALCDEMGLTMTTAFTVFAKAVTKKRAIPFLISAENIVKRRETTDTAENLAGVLHRYADSSLIPYDNEEWDKAIKEKQTVE